MHSRTRCLLRLALVLTLSFTSLETLPISANAAPHLESPEIQAWDHSAQVPTSEANTLSEAERSALQLGTRRLASELLTHRPSRELREAAAGGGSKKLLWPLSTGHFVRGFGYVRKVRKDLPHLGVDIAAKTGTPIHAAADGLVAYADDGVKGYGNLAILVHADGGVTSYAHCDTLLVRPGTRVARGDKIATVGSTGISSGPHLHFELRTRGKPQNPMPRFDRDLPQPVDPVLLSSL